MISILRLDNFRGRLLTLAPKDKENNQVIIMVSGHRTSLERYVGISQVLSDYGQVLVPDLPGFGGMTSFYQVGQQPSLDNYADYLYAFIKFKNPAQFSLVGLSFGFLVITRLLERYPELVERTKTVVSLVGFSPKALCLGRAQPFYRILTGLVARHPSDWLWRGLALNTIALRLFYNYSRFGNNRFRGLDDSTRSQLIETEIGLWHLNDVRTWAATAKQMLTTNLEGKIRKPLWHVFTPQDKLINNKLNAQLLGKVYQTVHLTPSQAPSHAPTIISEENARTYLPDNLDEIFLTKQV